MMQRSDMRSAAAATIILTLGAVAQGAPAHAQETFGLLVGKWGGSGLMALDDGSKHRLVCDATYSGGSTQLALAISCTGGKRKIDMRAKLSANASRLFGTWEERSYNVIGTVTGTATANKIDFNVIGVIQGKMTVSYSKSRQKVSISVQGLPLRTVTMDMKRR